MNDYGNKHLLLIVKGLSVALIIMYGLVPYYFSVILGLGAYPGAESNAYFSFILLAGFLVFANYMYLTHKTILNITVKPSSWFIIVIFFMALISFYYFPWIKDRESLGAKMSAVMRISWLLVVVIYKDRRAGWLTIMTIFLMLIDQSRTYFFVALAVLMARIDKRYWFFLGAFFVFIVGFVAITRDSSLDAFNVVDILMYGLKGEGLNGSLGVMQILPFSNDASLISVLSPFVHPFLAPVNSVLKYLSLQPLDGSLVNSDIIFNRTGEVYYPMGGFYILSEFVSFGEIGAILLASYLWFSLLILSKIVRINGLNIGIAFLPLAIKSTPYVFWNMVFAFIILCIFVLFLLKINSMLVIVSSKVSHKIETVV